MTNEKTSDYLPTLRKIEALEAEIETLRKDAERYRWLRNQWINEFEESASMDGWNAVMHAQTEQDMDAAIDAAITKELT